MSIQLTAHSLVAVKNKVTKAGVPITTTSPIEINLRDFLIAVLDTVPNQGAATATVAGLVTALKTIPTQA